MDSFTTLSHCSGMPLSFLFIIIIITAYGPAVLSVVALDPPPIKYTEINCSVYTCLLAACTARLVRPPRGIKPDINPCNQMPCKMHIISLNHYYLAKKILHLRDLINPFYKFLPWFISRVCLSCK